MSSNSIWISLRNRTFRRLWIATVISGCGVSAHDTAATWMMHTVSSSPFMISLMSTVASLPFFLFTIPAGALADMIDRRRILSVMNLWLASCAGMLAIFGFLNAFCFLLVTGAILSWRRSTLQARLPLENFFEAFVSAVRYVRYAPGIQVVLVRDVVFSFFISVIPALLPVVGLRVLNLDSRGL